MKTSLCLIVKPTDDEAKLLNRCLGFVAQYVDEVVITITGRNKEIEKVCKEYKAKVSHFDWTGNFADARNFNFSQATGDFLFWIDSDDCVRGAEHLPEVIKSMEEKGVDTGVMDYLYHFDEFKQCDVTHKKVRILKNDGCVKWFGAIHEDLLQQREIKQYFVPEIQVLHLTDDKRIDQSRVRNLEIAKQQLKDKPEDPTSWWNVANAYQGNGNHEEALKHFIEFVKTSGSDDEIALAYYRMSACYFDQGQTEDALRCAEKVIEMRPWFPDGYLLMGELFVKTQKFKHAKEMLVIGLSKEVPVDEAIVWNPRDYDYNPLMLLHKCYIDLGRPEDAKKCLEGCLKIYPDHPRVKELLAVTNNEIDKLKKVDEVVEKAKLIKDKNELKELLDTVPEELMSHPKIALIRNIHFIKTESSGKDLAIFCYSTLEEFNPYLVKTRGSGGSEEAVVWMSKYLKELGYNVTVYCSCGMQEMDFDGVMWKPWWLFNARDKWDVVVSWRSPMLAQFDELNCDNLYVWLHDVIKPTEFNTKRLKRIKKIFALSQYQRDLFPEVPDDKFVISGNGIDAETFKQKRGTIKRDKHRLIYTSSYDRGLLTLLKLFPRIRGAEPKAELHIFYGWNTWDKFYSNDPQKKKEKLEIEELMKQPGVVHHGRANQDQIIDEYFKSSILAYPTEFTEISYISGMKAQAAGCIPVTTDIYAMKENIQHGAKVKATDIYTNKEAQDRWVSWVIDLLKNPLREEDRIPMMDWACTKFDWKSVASQWDKQFSND